MAILCSQKLNTFKKPLELKNFREHCREIRKKLKPEEARQKVEKKLLERKRVEKKEEKEVKKMKKLITIGIAVLFVLGVSVSAYALSDNENIGVTLNVGTVFSITAVEDAEGGDQLIDIGLVSGGDEVGGNIVMYCSTNQGKPWTIQVHGEDLTNEGETLSIPVGNIKFSMWAGGDQAGTGTVYTDVIMTTADQPAYMASIFECSDTDVRVSMGITVSVPWSQTEGYYGGDITITMTE